MIASLLIANRGEIACRVIRTARRLGIRTIAVYSDADADALHVREADQAVHIGPSPARESYLVGERILEAARATGAEAIHPGYGFLSENAQFAAAVIEAGIIWVGPDPASITAMGLKDAAKRLMAEAGVPVTPGYLGENQDPPFLAAQADAIGYPVLIKAVAGGGGKGMRLVDNPADFIEALASCQREASSSFGNAHVLIEKYIQRPRHIEVQIFGDRHGNIVHLFERDCSLQRRHQKVIEEAPAPGMDTAMRGQLCAAAVRAARAVNYVGAGTIEFIADGSGPLSADRIWFMEMNTRLQVEHPVTEEITGIDLVEWQLRVASGEPLPKVQEEIEINGWAMEARLYAENPAADFLPSIGRLDLLRFGTTKGGRVDTGVYQGAEVSPYYDPMIAKVIARGEMRESARRRLSDMLSDTAIWSLKTNASFLVQALDHPSFVTGDVDTGLIGRDGEMLAMPPAISPDVLGDAAARLVEAQPMLGFRLNGPPKRSARFLLDDEAMEIALTIGRPHPVTSTMVTYRGQTRRFSQWRRDAAQGAASGDGEILAPMPGRIMAVQIGIGDRLVKGQKLLTLEAMKMEHSLTAPFDGIVAELNAIVGAQVQVDALLVRIEATDN